MDDHDTQCEAASVSHGPGYYFPGVPCKCAERKGVTEAARLSRMLWDAREILSMFGEHLELSTGKKDRYIDRTLKQIDEYRAEKGWSPDGFGGET
jgi:hypothetical protein